MGSFIPLLAFGFGHLAMLGWLGAAAAPLLIHLWNRRRYREVPWAAIEYLLAALRKNARRIQIEQWILLVVRCLLIALVVFALAEPYLELLGLKLAAGDHVHRILVLDGSYSMGYKPADKTRFERAKELATEIVDQSSQGDGFTLVLMSDPPRVVVGSPAFEPNDFNEEIKNLQLVPTPASICPARWSKCRRSSIARNTINRGWPGTRFIFSATCSVSAGCPICRAAAPAPNFIG